MQLFEPLEKIAAIGLPRHIFLFSLQKIARQKRFSENSKQFYKKLYITPPS